MPLLINRIEEIQSFEEMEKDSLSFNSIPFILISKLPPSIIQFQSSSSSSPSSTTTLPPPLLSFPSPALQKAIHSFHSSFPYLTRLLLSKTILAILSNQTHAISLITQSLYSTPTPFLESLLSLLLLTVEEYAQIPLISSQPGAYHAILQLFLPDYEDQIGPGIHKENELEQTFCLIACQIARYRSSDLTKAALHSFTDSIYRLFHLYCNQITQLQSSSSRLVVEIASDQPSPLSSNWLYEKAITSLQGLDIALLSSLQLCNPSSSTSKTPNTSNISNTSTAAGRAVLSLPTSPVSRFVTAFQTAIDHSITPTLSSSSSSSSIADNADNKVELSLLLYYLRYLVEKMEKESGKYLFERLVPCFAQIANSLSKPIQLQQSFQKVITTTVSTLHDSLYSYP